jgi:folate-binding protein YgfZ
MSPERYQRLVAGETCTATLGDRARWRLSGPDRVRYLNGQVTTDVAALSENTAAYAAVCTAKGRMEGDVWVAAHGDEFFLDAVGELRESLGQRLQKYLIADDAELVDITEEWSLSHIFGETLPELPDNAFSVPNVRFGLLGHDVWITGLGAVTLGESVDAQTLETLRLEYGIPRWGAELGPQTLPPEAGPSMLHAISYTKGCYVGQETIARLKSVGHVNRTLVLLASESDVPPALGAKVVHADKDAGVITTAGYSPRLQRGLGMAYVPRDLAAEGTAFRVGQLPVAVISPLTAAVL